MTEDLPRSKHPTLLGIPEPSDERPPPTFAQRQLIGEVVLDTLPHVQPLLDHAIAEAMKPVLGTWDARSGDMLDVLREAGEAKAQVRRAVATIKACAWLTVLLMLVAGGCLWVALERERADRRAFRESEQARRREAAELIVKRTEAACRPPAP